jgi:hypothetical protein
MSMVFVLIIDYSLRNNSLTANLVELVLISRFVHLDTAPQHTKPRTSELKIAWLGSLGWIPERSGASKCITGNS